MADNSISEIGVLSLMLDLETVTLTNNPITSIASLSACGKLQQSHHLHRQPQRLREAPVSGHLRL